MAIDPKSLTVDYKDLLKNTGFKKQDLTGQQPNDEYKKRLASLSPTDIARGLKPEYLTKGDMKDALSGDKSKSQAGGGDGRDGGPGGRNRRNNNNDDGRSKVQERQQLTNEQKQTLRDLKDGNIDINDPRAKFLNGLDENGLKAAGIEKFTDRNATEYRLIPKERKVLSDDEVRERSKGVKEGTEGLEGKEKLQKQVYDAFKKQGMSDNQAKALTAEVGRENDFNPNLLYGKHTDAGANRLTNIGMLSWQGDRNDQLTKRLQDKGLIDKNGNIVQGQEAINEMAAFIKHEIETKKEYERTKKEFLDNPNVTPEQAAEVLGNNYIRWDMAGKYINAQKHKDKRDAYAKEIQAIANKFPDLLPPNATPEQIEEARIKLQKIDDDKEANTREKQVGDLMDDARRKSDPQATTDSSKLLKYDAKSDNLKEDNQRLFHQEGKFVAKDGTPLDKRLVHIMKEASKDLPPGYRAEMISGADPRDTGTSNHPSGLAMDVQIFDEKGKLVPHDRNSPGWAHYERLHRSAVYRGKELYPDVEQIWGGAWSGGAAGPADPMHYQIKKRGVGSQGSGAYDFRRGLPKDFRFRDGSGSNAMSDKEREEYDKKVLAKMEAERQDRIAKKEQEKKEKEEKSAAAKAATITPSEPNKPTASPSKPTEAKATAKPEPAKPAESKPTEPAKATEPEKPTEPEQKQAESSPAHDRPPVLAQGGDIPIENTDQVTAVPVPEVRDSGGRENIGIMENEKMVAKVSSQEQLKYDARNKKIEVTPEHKVKPEQLERNEKAKDDNRRENEETQRQQTQNTLSNNPPYSPNRDFINPVVPTDHVLNTSQHRHFERAQYFAGSRHYNHGATNERGGV